MAPTTTAQWNVTGRSGFDDLKFTESAKIPSLGDNDVLVQFHYASLNYRDLIIPKGQYPFPQSENVVPGSDGAGTVISTGRTVKEWKAGDKVLTLFNQGHQFGPHRPADMITGVGGVVDGTLRQYGVYPGSGLVRQPETLSAQEASTLSCAAVTAWNALYGLESKKLMNGQWVLTQGTGGVSTFALQFAKAAGAKVVATTSSKEKMEKLKELGADVVLNYKENEKWGEEAKKLANGGEGVDHVVEVGGPKTLAQSLQAIKLEGVVSIIGFVGGMQEKQPTFLECLTNLCIVRGVYVGSKAQFEDMNKAIDVSGIKPVVDEKVFALKDLKDAYQYMWNQKHLGKLTVKIDD
ncbi:MAG: hypothetical protein MMC23_006344 [Stictis urceolatum]|nr:hypothetical protein [Stictis urceolata]